MGTPLIENPEGQASFACFGSGLPFGAEGVPHIVTAHFTGWEPAGQFLEEYRLELETPKQLYQASNPLHWHAESADWHWHLFWVSGVTQFLLERQPVPILAFKNQNASPCSLIIPNTLSVPQIVIALGGVMNIAFSQVFTL